MNSMENLATHLDKDNNKIMDYGSSERKSKLNGNKEANLCPYCLSPEFRCIETNAVKPSKLTFTGFKLSKVYHCEICGYTDERLCN